MPHGGNRKSKNQNANLRFDQVTISEAAEKMANMPSGRRTDLKKPSLTLDEVSLGDAAKKMKTGVSPFHS
jgi:hypothetical protein